MYVPVMPVSDSCKSADAAKVNFLAKLCKYKARKQFFVNAVVKLQSMLPDEVGSFSSIGRGTTYLS